MSLLLKNGQVYSDGVLSPMSLFSDNGFFTDTATDPTILNCDSFVIFPGFADVHVHLREPGFSFKETIRTGTMASAHGGYTDVCSMPNLSPTPDSEEGLAPQLSAIEKDAVIHVHPYGTITKGQNGEMLSDMEKISGKVIAFSDDGKGVQQDEMMEKAMLEAKRLGKMIVAHCEDNSLLFGGYIHDGEYAKAHGHRGICSASEYKQIERDLHLAAKTGCSYHVCHISTKESVALIREAKKAGVDVTCETGPHYLLMSDRDLQEDGRFKMNPPLRSEADKQALLEGICDGTIDMIATDHAPHTAEEKGRGLEKSLMGIVGIETAFPLLYTYLVRKNVISLQRLVELLHDAPCKRFGIGNPIAVGEKANCTVFDLNASYKIDPETFLSMGRATPFTGWEVYGKCMYTLCDGRIAYQSI